MLPNKWVHAFAKPACTFLSKPNKTRIDRLSRPRWAICADALTTKQATGLGTNSSAPTSVVKKPSGIPPPPSTSSEVIPAPAPVPKVYEVNGRIYEELPWSTATALAATVMEKARAGNYDCVLAITRGGLAPAALVAEGLGIRNVLAATVMFYTDEGDVFFGLRVPRFLSFPTSTLLEGRRVLVVDDVWDSGRTASAVRDRAERAGAEEVGVAVLHYKKEEIQKQQKQMTMQKDGEGKEGPDYFGATTKRWILYPWEVLAIEQMNKE